MKSIDYKILIFILIDFIFLSLYTTELSISYREAKIFFLQNSLLTDITHFFVDIFGQNDFAIRLPFILLHSLNIFLIYKISQYFLKKEIDIYLTIFIFTTLPGVNSSAIIISQSNIVLFITLLFIFLFIKKNPLSNLILIFSILIDKSFIILYISLIFFSISTRDKKILFLSLALFSLSLYLFDFIEKGKPNSHFLDTFGIYSAIFSPLLFLYFFYSIYRILIKHKKNILWYISFSSLSISLLLSIRQKIDIVFFAPFLIISIPLMVKVFFNSYRVRLSQFRIIYKSLLLITIFFLITNFLIIFFNKPLYFIFNKEHNFARKFHIAKELALELKKLNYKNIEIEDERLALRLKFYNITNSNKNIYLSKVKRDSIESIDIRYLGLLVDKFYINRKEI